MIGNYKGRSRYRLKIIGKNIICCQWLIQFLIHRTIYQTHSNCKSRLLNIKVITAEPQRFYVGSLYTKKLRSINHPNLSVNGSCSCFDLDNMHVISFKYLHGHLLVLLLVYKQNLKKMQVIENKQYHN